MRATPSPRWHHEILLSEEQIEDTDTLVEIDAWCTTEFGPKGGSWRSFSFGAYVFSRPEDAFAFKIRWNGEVL